MKTIRCIPFIAILTLSLSCSKEETTNKAEDAGLSKKEMIARGQYLVAMAGCNDCHSPKSFGATGPVPDSTRILSGHPSDMPIGPVRQEELSSWVLFNHHSTAAVGPWGISFAANLTPDETGIGNWTFEQFSKAMREGKYKGLEGTRPLLPPMPWPNYIGVSEEDMQAIFAFLKSLKPVKNIVPNYIPAEEIAGTR
ncbi:MAG: c-type cytochrome [Cyclobacteriaceae bacterium]